MNNSEKQRSSGSRIPSWRKVLGSAGIMAILAGAPSCDSVNTSKNGDSSHSIELSDEQSSLTTEERIANLNDEISRSEAELTPLIEERDQLQWHVDFYKQLEEHKGKPIYAVVEQASPTDITHYFFSKKEKDDFVQNLQAEINQYLQFTKEHPQEEAIGPVGIQMSSKVLDQMYFEEIVREYAQRPFAFTGKDFWVQKADELGIDLE